MPESNDLIVIGGNAGGLSAAVFARESGLERVTVLEEGSTLALPGVAGEYGLEVSYGETVTSVDLDGEDLVVTTKRQTLRGRAVLVALRDAVDGWTPPVPTQTSDRVHLDEIPTPANDVDVLVVGYTDHAVELTVQLADLGAGVVLAAGGMNPRRLSPVGARLLSDLERERRATLLYSSKPHQVGDVDGYPMAYFNDRRTPDLQFDHVVFSSGRRTVAPSLVGATEAALGTARIWFLGSDSETPEGVPSATGASIGRELVSAVFPTAAIPAPEPSAWSRHGVPGVIDELRDEHYNATITHFEPTHSDLWVLRVKPDHGSVSHLPGQYASLGLGYWEDRVDDAMESNIDERWDKLVRRSYSISHRIFDEHGYLADEGGAGELEFYIVLVPPTPDNVPGLTPRLALKKPGDRIYLGPKVAGRYTLAPVIDPADTVIFLSTGTGEAPQNAMVTELLRKGHHGPIVSAVSVREWADLGYLDKHRQLEKRYGNYHYFPQPTREADIPKRYLQDLIRDDVFGAEYGVELDPSNTHVFLCGNPSMIGLPEEGDGGEVIYPETVGVVQLLAERGFTLDHRKERGNVHYEEYW